MNDPFEKEAQSLSHEEASILAHFAANENFSEIAITMELDPKRVIATIREKGKDRRDYARNVALAWRKLNPPAHRMGLGMMSTDVIAAGPAATRGQVAVSTLRQALQQPAASSPPVQRPAPVTPRKVTKPATPKAPVRSTPRASVRQDNEITTAVRQQETAPVPVAEDLPLAPWPESGKDGEPAEPSSPSSTTEEHPSVPDRVESAATSSSIEDLLTWAEKCGNAGLEQAAREIREDIVVLARALEVSSRADKIRQRIIQLDAERDSLRRELEELMSSDVMVSASSGRLRRPMLADPDDETLRSWGLEQGFQMDAEAKVPHGVLVAYRKAKRLSVA